MTRRPDDPDDTEQAERVARAQAIRESMTQGVSRPPHSPREFIAGVMQEQGVLGPPRTLRALLDQPVHDVGWLKRALEAAFRLELFTIPPYLTAYWSIVDSGSYAARSLQHVWMEEMLHLGLVANLMVAIGGTVSFREGARAISYPGPLPGNVSPGLVIGLSGLSKETLEGFMSLERPKAPLVAAVEEFATIGEFYEAVRDAFTANAPPLDVSRQISDGGELFVIETPALVKKAIDLIRVQGEGSVASPFEGQAQSLAHYYRFAEVFHGKRLAPDPAGTWSFAGDDIPLPVARAITDVPPGGWDLTTVRDEVGAALREFDGLYSNLLAQLDGAWNGGGSAALEDAQDSGMSALGPAAAKIMALSLPGSARKYTPHFRVG